MSRCGFARPTRFVAILLLFAPPPVAVAQVPPDIRYRTFETEHFRVIFPGALESFAQRAAERAEWAYHSLAQGFMEPPAGRIALVLTEHTNLPNASATPIPTNRVVLIAAPDIASRDLNYYTDWVDVTLVHELTHIFHLDRADGVWGLAQKVFGRVPAFFPAFYQPRWVIEGLASYYESRLTGAGRAYGSGFQTLLANDAASSRFRTIDTANGLAPLWPAGNTPYAYGGLYFRDMAARHGDSAVARFAVRGAARLPYTLNWASTPFFGQTLTGSWNDWSAEFRRMVSAGRDSLMSTRQAAGGGLSGYAWTSPVPRFSPDGRYLAFTSLTPDNDSETRIIAFGTGELVMNTRRNGGGGNTWGRGGDTVYSTQFEYTGRYQLYSDLYALDLSNGRDRRLTRGWRVSSPDLAPDGRTLVVVETGSGTNRLLLLDVTTLARTPLSAFVDSVNWERPRWSPDGRWIAAERVVRGEIVDIVVLGRSGTVEWQVTRDEAADMTPAWSPDGRYLLWASDRAGTHDIYAAPVAVALAGGTRPSERGDGEETDIWQVTRSTGGASDPEVSPDGRTLVFSALHSEGLRVEWLPFERANWSPTRPSSRSLRRPVSSSRGPGEAGLRPTVRPYSPFPSLWPKFWLPIAFGGSRGVGAFLGATTLGSDDVRRHSYAVLAGWRTEAEAVEGTLVYRYAGFGDPVVEIGISQEWSARSLITADGLEVDALERERDARIALGFLRPRVRNVLSIVPALGWEERNFTPLDAGISFSNPTFADAIAELFIGYSTARAYPRSISLERGVTVLLDLAHRRLLEDFGLWVSSAETELRGYLALPAFGFSNHVLAARVALGASRAASERSPELFALGGVPGRPLQLFEGFGIGGGSRYAVRGFTEGVQVGDRVASVNLEYRVPFALIGRGYGLWPFLFDRLSAALFVDSGSAWRHDEGHIEVLASSGAELSLDLGLGYEIVYRFRGGFAVPVVDSGGGVNLYLSTGVAF